MGDLVCDGTEFTCPLCTSKLKLSVPSSPAKGEGKNLANMSNCFFPPPGGQCTLVPSAPVPCTPAATPVDPGQKPVKISEVPALGAGCKFQCAKGGLLTVSSSGQSKAKHEEASGIGGAAAAAAASLLGLPKKEEEPDPNKPLTKEQKETVQKSLDDPPNERTKQSRAAHAYSKHAGRKPEIWGKPKGNNQNLHNQGVKHFNEVFDGPGKFVKTPVKGKPNAHFWDKRLPDGRGVRLQGDLKFKGFID